MASYEVGKNPAVDTFLYGWEIPGRETWKEGDPVPDWWNGNHSEVPIDNPPPRMRRRRPDAPPASPAARLNPDMTVVEPDDDPPLSDGRSPLRTPSFSSAPAESLPALDVEKPAVEMPHPSPQ